MKHVVVSLCLSAFAGISFAQSTGRTVVPQPQDCPGETTPNVYYKWQDGHLVRDGWICQERINPRS